MSNIYIDCGDETSGPFSREAVIQMIRSGELSGSDEIWIEGAPDTVPVARLLRGHDPASADEWLFDGLASDERPTSSSERSRAHHRAHALIDALAMLPAFGLRAHACGGTLLAVFILGLYLWGTYQMNASGERQRNLSELKTKVVLHADRHPEAGLFTLDDLKADGVVTSDDLDLIEVMKLTYHPIGAASPGEALVFTRAAEDHEDLYYKRRHDDRNAWWLSPDERYKFVSAVSFPPGDWRVLSLLDAASGRVLATHPSPARYAHAKWRSDSRLIAVHESDPGGIDRLSLWDASRARRLDVPADIEPESALRPDDRQLDRQWSLVQITPDRWRSDGCLEVEVYGSARLFNAGQPAGSVMLRNRFVLHIAADGTVSVAERKEVSYHRAGPHEPRPPKWGIGPT